MRATPIKRRKLSARILTVGCLFDKTTDATRGKHHEDDREDHGQDHDDHLVRHSDGGDDGVEREDEIEKHDLDQDARKGGRPSLRGMTFLSFKFIVDFEGGLRQKEESSCHEDQIPC